MRRLEGSRATEWKKSVSQPGILALNYLKTILESPLDCKEIQPVNKMDHSIKTYVYTEVTLHSDFSF